MYNCGFNFASMDSYSDAMLQYGFATLFVVAFPLAPLLAAIANMIELKLGKYQWKKWSAFTLQVYSDLNRRFREGLEADVTTSTQASCRNWIMVSLTGFEFMLIT